MLLAGSLLYFANKTLFAFSALALFYGAALLYMLRDRSVLQRFCRLRLFHLLSRLSYGMYLNHFPILLFGMPVVMPFVAKLGLGTNGFWLGGLVIVALSLLVSLTTFAFIESPFLRLRDRWLGQSVGAMPEGKFSMAATSSRGSRRGSEERGLTETAPP